MNRQDDRSPRTSKGQRVIDVQTGFDDRQRDHHGDRHGQRSHRSTGERTGGFHERDCTQPKAVGRRFSVRIPGTMVTRILAVVSALLAALVIHQYSQIGQLRAEVANAEERGSINAKSSMVSSLSEQGGEIQRTMSWLNDFYKGPDGLQRPSGLWIDGHPDFEGLSVGFSLPAAPPQGRSRNKPAGSGRCHQSEEWQVKYKG